MPKVLKRIPTAQKLIFDAPMTIAGIEFHPGDVLPREVQEKIPVKNLDAMKRTGVLVLAAPAEVSPKVRGLRERRGAAQIELANVQAIRARIRNDKIEAERRAQLLAKERAAGALAAYREGGMKPGGDELRRARDELADLDAADGQAQQEEIRLRREINRLDREVKFTCAEEIINERLGLADDIMPAIGTLIPLFQKFNATAARFERLIPGSNQIASDWRLKAVIDEHLLGHAIAPSLRVTDLREFEARIYGDVLARAIRAAEKQSD